MTGECTASRADHHDQPNARARAQGNEGPGHYLSWGRAGRDTLPHYLLGLGLVLAAWAVGTLGAQLGLLFLGLPAPSTPAAQLAFMVSTFALGLVAVPWIVRRVLRRPGWTVGVARPPGPIRHVALGAGISLCAALLVDVLFIPMAPLQRGTFDPSVWLPLAGVALVGFAVQAGFEELLFRGYLMQLVASRTTRAALVIVLPAACFALPHWGNLEAYGTNPAQLVPYLAMGLMYGWAAWRSGSLWLPFGLHWGNNVYATLMIAAVGDVLPTGAPLSRDLAELPLGVLVTTTAMQCLLQVCAVSFVLRGSRFPFGTRARPTAGELRVGVGGG